MSSSHWPDTLARLADELAAAAIEEFEARYDGVRVRIRRSATAGAFVPARPASAAEQAPQGTPVRAPIAGVFYRAATPGADPFVRAGDVVAVGQVIALIEAMKVFNEIVSDAEGTLLSFAVENGALVQAGEPIAYIAPVAA